MWKPQPHRPGLENKPAPLGGDRVLSPDHKSFHTFTTPTTWEPRDETEIPRVDTAPRGVETSTPHELIADWLGLMEPARGESCRTGQRRGRAASGEDKFPSPDQKSFHTYSCDNPETNAEIPRVDIARTVWKPQPHWLIADW